MFGTAGSLFGASQGYAAESSQGQGLGLGGYSSGPTAGEQQKRGGQRQEGPQNCLPVTVRLVEQAVEAKVPDAELRFHGKEAGQLVVVGAVEGLVKQPTGLEFTLNDATGRLRVRHFFQGGSMPPALEKIEAGAYVSLVGSVRTSPSVHFGALWLSPVTTADQISYHMIEVAHAALKMRQAEQRPVAVFAQAVPEPGYAQTPEPKRARDEAVDAVMTPAKPETPAQEASVAAPVSASPAPLEGDALKQAVRSAMEKLCEGRGDEGVDVSEVCRHFSDVASAKLREALKALEADGDLYTTMDDDHFAILA